MSHHLNAQENLYAWKVKNPNVPWFENSTSWSTVRTLYPNGSGVTYGPEISFAYEMQRRTGNKIAVIKVAEGGAGLERDWLPSKNDVYPWAIAKVQSSLAELAGLGYEANLSGVVWVQGETDATNAWTTYQENLVTLFDQFKVDLDAPDLPIYLNLLHQGTKYPHRADVRQEQLGFLATYPNARGFESSDLPILADGEHYGAEGQLALGRRFANLIHPWADFDGSGVVDDLDLATWTAAAGQTNQGDANADGVTDGADFLLWQQQTVQAAEPDPTPLPEPRGLVMVAFALAYSVSRSRFHI